MRKTRLIALATVLVAGALMTVSTAFAQGKVNINTASKHRLESLPGVGRDIAVLIINYRRENGSFKSVSELENIPGIGRKRFDGLKSAVTVGMLMEKSQKSQKNL